MGCVLELVFLTSYETWIKVGGGLASGSCSEAECLRGFSFQEGFRFSFVLSSLSFDGGEMGSVIEEIPAE